MVSQTFGRWSVRTEMIIFGPQDSSNAVTKMLAENVKSAKNLLISALRNKSILMDPVMDNFQNLVFSLTP